MSPRPASSASRERPVPADLGVDAWRDLPTVGLVLLDALSLQWLAVNDGACRLLATSREQLLARGFAGVIHPDDLAATMETCRHLRHGDRMESRADVRCRRTDGEIIWVDLTIRHVTDRASARLVACLVNVTPRVEAEAAAQEAATLLEKFSANVPGVLYQFVLAVDGQMAVPFATHRIHALFDLHAPPRSDSAQPLLERILPEDLPRVRRSVVESATTLTPWHEEFRITDQAGHLHWLRGDARPQREADGATRWFGFMADITEARRQQQALEASERQLRQLFELAPEGILVLDGQTGHYVDANPMALTMLGYAREDLIGRAVPTLCAPVQPGGDAPGHLFAAASAPDFVGPVLVGEWHAIHADGHIVPLALRITRIPTEGRALLRASFTDVTETRRLEVELQQAQKLESVGRLAGGVAHDFNNLLTVIKASLDLALADLPADSVARSDLREAARATDSAARLTQQLLAFSRKQAIAPTTLNLNDVVHRVSGMLQRLLGEDIVLRTITAHDLWSVHFDAGQAEQVLVNLAVNARDAMPRGGTLTLETRNLRVDDDMARRHPGLHPDDYVLLTVSDTGLGMSEEVLAHAFEPFFTTKARGHGTGLGLAVIHGAVTQHGGRVEVSSLLGVGTTFRIFMPRKAALASRDLEETAVAIPRGTETILLVEDDDTVRPLIQRQLVQHGYQVFAFPGGHEALGWLTTTAEPVHLLLTDVIMPGMNGRDLADAVASLRPQIRVLFASGYTASVIARQGGLEASQAYLPKPFSIRELAAAVRQAIDRPPSPMVRSNATPPPVP